MQARGNGERLLPALPFLSIKLTSHHLLCVAAVWEGVWHVWRIIMAASNAQMLLCSNAQMHKYTNAQMLMIRAHFRCPSLMPCTITLVRCLQLPKLTLPSTRLSSQAAALSKPLEAVKQMHKVPCRGP